MNICIVLFLVYLQVDFFVSFDIDTLGEPLDLSRKIPEFVFTFISNTIDLFDRTNNKQSNKYGKNSQFSVSVKLTNECISLINNIESIHLPINELKLKIVVCISRNGGVRGN